MPLVARTIAMGLGLLGGVIASQGPEFGQQYRQRLGGAVDELRRVVERFEADARQGGEGRDVALGRLRANPDRLVRRQGDAMHANIDRLARLEGQQRRLSEAGPFRRLTIMATEADPAIAQAAYRDYEPAVPTTTEGLVTAGIGFSLVWLGSLFVAHLARHWRLRPRVRAA
jgi:hypothetical protein